MYAARIKEQGAVLARKTGGKKSIVHPGDRSTGCHTLQNAAIGKRNITVSVLWRVGWSESLAANSSTVPTWVVYGAPRNKKKIIDQRLFWSLPAPAPGWECFSAALRRKNLRNLLSTAKGNYFLF